MRQYKWRSLGLVFQPSRAQWWMRSHASLPVPLQLEGTHYRVYFASRDVQNRSHVGWFDIDLEDPTAVLAVAEEPVLVPGPLGHFDDHGIYAASVVRDADVIHLYTIGWNPGVPDPLFYASIGHAVSRDGGETFTKSGSAPMLARSEHDPCLVTSPFVVKEEDRWRMYYVSGYRWDEDDSGLHSNYHIKYAESQDGTTWKRDGRVCLDTIGDERNIGRTCVVHGPDGWEAWYSFTRAGQYRIGVAFSDDGLTWQRRDDLAGVSPSGEPWDSEAQAYPYVISHGTQRFMFYNGNSFGRDGVGLAICHA